MKPIQFQKRRIRLMVIPPAAGAVILLLLTAAALITGHLQPASRTTILFYGYPLKGITVVLDPGHGGIDPGAHYNGVVLEKEIVLAVGLELRRLLEPSGAAVIMTREVDQEMSRYIPGDPSSRHKRDLRSRIMIINESQADLFVSLHINAIADPSVRGAIAFYCPSRPDNKTLAELIQKNINPLMAANPNTDQTVHMNPKEGNFYILNDTTIPGIILEIGFMTSPIDRELMTGRITQKKLAQSIFLGIAEFICARNNHP
ncbi:MAG: N-acetylmuramoyl-L-alanine amidase [Bacillota bacterium]